jgi:predicted DNA-binding transcriptional regulator AlpA
MTFDVDITRTHDRLLPWKTVKDLTGLSRTTAWRLQKAGDFPLPVGISPGRVGWRESEISAWSASRRPGRRPVPAAKPERSFAPESAPARAETQAPEPALPVRATTDAAPARRPSKRGRSASAQMTLNF